MDERRIISSRLGLYFTALHPSGEYIAYREIDIGEEGRVETMGYGTTREAAVADLIEQLED